MLGLVLCTACATQTAPPASTEDSNFFATTKGWVTRINRSDSWFELKPKSGGNPLTINYDATTTLLNFKGMIEIAKEQPLEVTYLPGSTPANRALSIRKLQPDECN
jgi:hypothetical protein